MSTRATTRWASDRTAGSVHPLRVGVVTDTHAGEHLPRIPAEVEELLAGCEVIVHAGDITDPAALDRLRTIAPVVAVCGDHDRPFSRELLPRDHVLEIGGGRIGVTHGNRARSIEHLARVLTFLRGRLVDLGLDRALLRRLGPIDCIVFGHLHIPRHRWIGRTLIFSPGAGFTVEHEPAGVWGGIGGRAIGRFRRGLAPDERRAAVGVITIGPDGLGAHRRVLARPLRGTLP